MLCVQRQCLGVAKQRDRLQRRLYRLYLSRRLSRLCRRKDSAKALKKESLLALRKQNQLARFREKNLTERLITLESELQKQLLMSESAETSTSEALTKADTIIAELQHRLKVQENRVNELESCLDEQQSFSEDQKSRLIEREAALSKSSRRFSKAQRKFDFSLATVKQDMDKVLDKKEQEVQQLQSQLKDITLALQNRDSESLRLQSELLLLRQKVTHSLCHSLTYPLTHLPTQSPTRFVTHSYSPFPLLSYSFTHFYTHSLSHPPTSITHLYHPPLPPTSTTHLYHPHEYMLTGSTHSRSTYLSDRECRRT